MGTENGLKLAGVSNVTAQAIGSEARRLRVYRNDTPPLPFKRRMSVPADKACSSGNQHGMRHSLSFISAKPTMVLAPELPHQTNQQTSAFPGLAACYSFVLLAFFVPPRLAAEENNFRRLLRTGVGLFDFGPGFTAGVRLPEGSRPL